MPHSPIKSAARVLAGMELVAELRALWTLWQPQMDAYVTRALDPADAPSYGVPGDL